MEASSAPHFAYHPEAASSGASGAGVSDDGVGVGSGVDEKQARKRSGARRRFRELFMDSYVVTR